MMKSWMCLLFFCALQGSDGQQRLPPELQKVFSECPEPPLNYTNCYVYGCFDSPPKQFQCLPYGDTGVYVITKCNSNWTGLTEIKEKCEGPTDFSDPVSAAPVTSQSRGLTYRNLYCAECNQAEMESLESFLHIPICKDLKDFPKEEIWNHLTYDQTKNIWGVKRSDDQGNPTFYECLIDFDVPEYLKESVRFCNPDVISECDPNWKNETVRQLCGEYIRILYIKGCIPYKNSHCAICNHINSAALDCVSTCARQRPLGFSDLFDVNRREECPAFHLYDPHKKKCRKLACALPGHVIRDSKCVKGD